MKKIIFFISVLIVFSCSLFGQTDEAKAAAEKGSEQGREVFEFVRDFIESLGYLEASSTYYEKASPASDKYDGAADGVASFKKNIRLANIELTKARKVINKYSGSTREAVKKTADFILPIYDKKIQINDGILVLYEKVYKPAAAKDPDQFDQEKLMSQVKELAGHSKEAMKLLFDCSVLVTHLLVDKKPDRGTSATHLIINSKQRKELIKAIDKIFPPAVKERVVPGQSYLDAAATAIRRLLVQPGWKSADKK